MSAAAICDRTRLRVRVSGAVQGVGFRPYVYGLARRYGLAGFVVNGPEGVTIEVEGNRASEFVAALPLEPPPLARIDHICVQRTGALAAQDFSIHTSEGGRLSTRIVADAATCRQCLGELFDPENRHYLYPFVSCSHCGPRYTIAEQLPYDRRNTVMLKRGLNVGFSGGEKKRNEILQMALLEPSLCILDEIDSGLDIDALRIVAGGINSLRSSERAMIVISHYRRLLDYIVPDVVHVMSKGQIRKSGGKELALELEACGYAQFEDAA